MVKISYNQNNSKNSAIYNRLPKHFYNRPILKGIRAGTDNRRPATRVGV